MTSSSSASNPLLGVQVTEKLTHQNHTMWSAQVHAILRGAKLERYVNGKAIAPSEEIDEKTTDNKIVKISNPAYSQRTRRFKGSFSCLCPGISRRTLPYQRPLLKHGRQSMSCSPPTRAQEPTKYPSPSPQPRRTT